MTVHLNILGVNVNTIHMVDALAHIDRSIRENARNYLCVTPAHTIMDAQDDVALRLILNRSSMTTPDGMSVVWLMKMRGQRQVGRVYGPDLLLETCQYGLAPTWRHFFYGGGAGVARGLAAKLKGQFQRLEIAGVHTPPFREMSPEEDRATVALINKTDPDIVWVGLSSPKQEFWMADHLGKIEAPVMIGVGAAFDFLSGNKPQAPRWIQRSGLEWLFRLATEPRRLWPRYRQYPKFLLLAVAQLLGLKDFPIED